MCRDEQLFTSYFDSLCEGNDPLVTEAVDGVPTRGESSGNALENERELNTGSTSKPTKKRKHTPVLKVRHDNNCLLLDSPVAELTNKVDWTEGGGEKNVAYQPFKLTDECPGDVYGNRKFIFEVLQQYAIMSRRPVYPSKNDKKRFRANCEGFVYWTKIKANNSNDYVLMTCQPEHSHTCSKVKENRWITSKLLAKRYTEKIKANPHIPLQSIRQCVNEEFGSSFSRMKAYRAREMTLEGIYRRTRDQYKKLFYYKHELERSHPNSTIDIQFEQHREDVSKGPRFLRFYCCLGPLKKGWKDWYRPVVFLDACFLTGMCKGQLFTAIGMDQNNGWWPIAWGVAESESYTQWKWFLDLLDIDLQLSENSPRFVFMSNQQKI
ncbi:hypothetical protein AAHA92_17060 [Salvia divinorum]|uniref:MULE transposase domain-containing protein n=1 Tax=Salvia divinorum TaxID=28513 RepID=A0ABD1GY25_SALDI